MKKAQQTIYVIIGLIIIIILIFFYISISHSKKTQIKDQSVDLQTFSFEKKQFQSYFNQCSNQAIILANINLGMHQSIKDEYESYVINEVDKCMAELFSKIIDKGFNISKEEASVNLEINDVNLIVTINYPVVISYKDMMFFFKDYIITFERVNIIKLDEIKDGNIFSTDNKLKLEIAENIEITDINNEIVDEILIKVADKKEFGDNKLEGNLVYGILPINRFANDQIGISIDVSNLDDVLVEDLRIAWFEPNSGQWGFLPTEYENGHLKSKTTYTSYFGVIQKQENPQNIPLLNTGSTLPEDLNSLLGGIDSPPIDYSLYLDGELNDIFNKIKAEMGGTYPLNPNSDCAPLNGAYCYVGYVETCGMTAVHCNVQTINGEEKEFINKLFRHEITHNLQQINGGYPGHRIKNEWGAEYYAKTTYYRFLVNGEWIGASELAQKMIDKGCTEEELQDAMVSKSGSYEVLQQKGCLFGKSGSDIADDYKN